MVRVRVRVRVREERRETEARQEEALINGKETVRGRD
jgi:hypothetical protein